MSLFSEFTQGEIIENPKATSSYKKALEIKKETEPVKTWKEIRNEMRAKLTPEEYKKWLQKESYQRKKEDIAKKYQEKKAEKEAYIEEIYKEVYDTLPGPPNYNKFYAEKYDADDRDWNHKFRFYWRNSRLNFIKASKLPKYKQPIRVYPRNFPLMMTRLWDMQDRAYKYIKPHINEISLKDFKLSIKQFFTKAPMWSFWGKMTELVNNTNISNNQIFSVASALLRDKYIINELYLWRCSFLVWDVIITQNWNVIRPILENNIPWLTKDTVEDLHQKRMDYFKRRTDDLQVYTLRDCYLMKVQPNERETLYYIVPT